jgi:Fe-S-cluster-containing hydrogenase component 2
LLEILSFREKAKTVTKRMNKPAQHGKTDSGRAMDKGVSFDMPTCGGCRTCEMACAFHHLGEFNPSASSLLILEKEKGPGYRVWLAAESGDQRFACDACKDLDVPLCLEYCREYDDLFKILQDFERKRKEPEGSKKG